MVPVQVDEFVRGSPRHGDGDGVDSGCNLHPYLGPRGSVGELTYHGISTHHIPSSVL